MVNKIDCRLKKNKGLTSCKNNPISDSRRKKLRKEYDVTRGKRDVLIGTIKKKRQELSKYTFADLDSRGKNPYINRIREQEKRLTQEYVKLDNRLNKIDHTL